MPEVKLVAVDDILTFLMGIYTFRAWFSVTAANPVGPGLHCADPSVSINMDLSEVQSQNF